MAVAAKVHDLDRELPPIRDEMSLVREQEGGHL